MDWHQVRGSLIDAARRGGCKTVGVESTTLFDCWHGSGKSVILGPVPEGVRGLLYQNIPKAVVDAFYAYQQFPPPMTTPAPSCCAVRKIDPATRALVCTYPGDYEVLLDPKTENALAAAFSQVAPVAHVKGSGHSGATFMVLIVAAILLVFVAPFILGKLTTRHDFGMP